MYEVAVVGSGGFLGRGIMRAFAADGVAAAGFTLERPLLQDGRLHPAASTVRTVVWCASRINARVAVDFPELIDEDRHDLGRALDAFLALPRPPRVVVLSSGGTVYGPPAPMPYREDGAVHPVNAYGRAKLDVERQVASSGLQSVALRVANAYGEGQLPAPGQGVLAHWIDAVLAGEALHLYGNPESTRDYIHVDDIARAAVAAHRAVDLPQIVNVGSGVPTSLEQLLTAFVATVAPHPVDVVRHAARDTDADHSVLDVSLGASAFDWRTTVSLGQGIAQQWTWRKGS